ncbi:scopoletin glucosyltransferase-like [Neltuma alba]|uniref:scopoletin glucosyltransferase-like n=1 Tax=Neltuma alba TaxID=207710 RepID=UPI0010A320BB|nr:scopoletin glucosyltransferase-like [Prosopis alba]XP_028783089.1 scopoletin glucosyltransferase-like [Prosopis alba]
MEAHPPPLKIYFVPFVAASHIVSLFELCRLFASRGLHVTILTTPSTTRFLHNSLLKAHAAGLRIHVHNLKFPSQEVGLPDGVENLIGVEDFDVAAKVYQGMRLLRHQMEQFMEPNPPDCIVGDIFHPWTSDFANRLGVPRLLFDGSGLFAACLSESVWRPDSPHRFVSSKSDPFPLLGLPHPITMTFSRLPDYIQTTNGVTTMMESFRDSELKCYGRIVNSFAELEEEYIEHYRKTMGKTVWHVGPTTLLNRSSEDKAERNLKAVVSEDEILSWLNSKPPNSVLYVCFGSAAYFTDEQLLEIASAMEFSGHKFIWVVHRKDRTESETEEDRQKWMPREFEERMRREDRGMVIRGWAPQTLILDHAAIGGFMTHCGWNSLMEGICAGVPMITWPLHSEQFFNEKLITQVHGIGVEVGADNCVMIMEHATKNLVKRHSIESAVRKLMDDGDETVKMRRRVRELAEKAKAAIEEDGGSSQMNLTALIEDLQRLKSMRTKAGIDHE